MSDLISRQAAIDAFDCTNELIVGGEANAQNVVNYINKVVGKIETLPSAQPESCEDAVSRRRLLNDLKELIAAWEKYPFMAEQIKGVEAAIGYVALIPSVTPKPEQRWIPCSERLPEQYGNYLVSYRTDDFESDIGTFDPNRINSDTGEWSACDANGFYWVASKGLEVIAWMPLPEPYREKGE